MTSVNYTLLSIFPGVLISGLSVYFILSYLLMPIRITLPLSIIISVLIFGLTRYYYAHKEQTTIRNNAQQIEKKSAESSITNFVFIVTYIVLLAVLVNSSSNATSGLFIDWQKVALFQIFYLTAAIAFSFFLPGYALVTLLNKKYKLRLLLRLLLAYFFSMLITGLGGYVSGSFGYQISNTTMMFIGTYILIFLFYLKHVNAFSRGFYHVPPDLFSKSLSKFRNSLINNYSQIIVFSSLFALVILYTYYLNDGKIVVDQWYHHGRALLIGSGLFKDLGTSDVYNQPFFSSLLAAFFNLSGSPSVNAYVAISFLNIVPVFAFYYFFTNWIPKNKQRAALLASTLFMLSAGFGWLYAINAAVDSHHRVTFDVSSSFEIIELTYRKTFDVETPTTFIDVGHPDITTPLIIIALPAGFTLLGLIKEVNLFKLNNDDDNKSSRPKSRYSRILTWMAIVTAISFLGILSHDEFFLFIIVACTAMVILFRQLPKNVNYSIFFVSLLSAISLVLLVDTFISPARIYTYRLILGIHLIILSFLFISFNWALYVFFRKTKFSNIFKTFRSKRQISIIKQQAKLKRIITLNFLNENQIRFVKLLLGMVIVSFVAYFYLFTVLVWNSLSVNQISSQIEEFANVPWYLYPIKFGLTGLLGLAFILSYLFKKFEKEIFIFGIIIIIAFFAGPYYDEHRFGKYIMAGMAAFAALLIYQIISSGRIGIDLKLRPLIVGVLLGIVVTSSSLSIFMYAGWVELFTGKSDWIEGGRWDFPTASEIQLLNFLNNKIIHSKAYNIALPEKETSNDKGFVTKIYGFSPTSKFKLLQNPLTLNASTLEGLYNLLNSTDVKYIILPKTGIIADTEKAGIMSSSKSNYIGNISNGLRFVLDNFPKAYEDQNYIVFEVLPLTPPSPSPTSSVALIYQRDFDELLPQVSNYTAILPKDSGLFGSQTLDNNTKDNSSYYDDIVIKDSKEGIKNLSSAYSLTLGDKVSKNNSKSITLWSHPIQQVQLHNALNSSENNRTIINYIEGNFRIIDDLPAQNKSEKKNADKFGAGIVWAHGNNTFLASISDVGLQLSQSPSKIALLTKQPANATRTAIGEAINILTAANATTNATGEIMTKANNVLNLAASAGSNATQTAMDQAKDFMTKASNNATNATGTPMTQPESVVSTPSKITSLTKQPEQVNNTNYLKQVLAKLILSQNEEGKRQKGIWYNLKILFLKNNVEIYLNDILRMKVPLKEYYNVSSDKKNITESISRVGINSYYSKSEFQPIIIGHIPNVTDHSYPSYQKIYYQDYYPLNILALSKIKYDTYIDGDLSAFSKKFVVLAFDKAPYQKNEASKYLEYVTKGGNLIVINSDNKFDGIFSKLLSIKPGNLTKFTSIETNNSAKTSEKNSINVSGIARSLEIYPNSNLTIKSYYMDRGNGNKSQNVAPFVIEKNYGNGTIIFVNAIGYFDSIFGKLYFSGNNSVNIKDPYFATLSKVAPMIGIPDDNQYVDKKSHPITIYSSSRIVGDIRISPEQTIIINSSYLLFPDSSIGGKNLASYNISASNVSVSAGHSQQISLTNLRLFNNNNPSNLTSNNLSPIPKKTGNDIASNDYNFKKVMVKDLELYGGPFEIIINVTNSTRPVYLPTSSSNNDYISMSIPKGFDMAIKFSGSNSTYALLDMIKKNEKNSFQRIKVSGYNNDTDNSNNSSTGQIVFHNVGTDIQSIRLITTLMKSPEIKIINEDKTKNIENAVDEENSSIKYRKNSPDSTPIEIPKGSGDITIKIDHVDNYDEAYNNWTRTKFITYLKNDIQITNDNKSINPQDKEQTFIAKLMTKRPSDISESAKEHGVEVPWRDVIRSTPSIIIAVTLFALIGAVITLTWFKIRKLRSIN